MGLHINSNGKHCSCENHSGVRGQEKYMKVIFSHWYNPKLPSKMTMGHIPSRPVISVCFFLPKRSLNSLSALNVLYVAGS